MYKTKILYNKKKRKPELHKSALNFLKHKSLNRSVNRKKVAEKNRKKFGKSVSLILRQVLTGTMD